MEFEALDAATENGSRKRAHCYSHAYPPDSGFIITIDNILTAAIFRISARSIRLTLSFTLVRKPSLHLKRNSLYDIASKNGRMSRSFSKRVD